MIVYWKCDGQLSTCRIFLKHVSVIYKGRCKELTIRGHTEKIRAPDGIRTHDPLCSRSDALTSEDSLTVKGHFCGLDLRTASRSHAVNHKQDMKMTLTRQRVLSTSEARASDLEHRGSWVRIPSGAQMFSVSSYGQFFTSLFISFIILISVAESSNFDYWGPQ